MKTEPENSEDLIGSLSEEMMNLLFSLVERLRQAGQQHGLWIIL